MRSVGSHSTSGREKEGIKEAMGRFYVDRWTKHQHKFGYKCLDGIVSLGFCALWSNINLTFS